MKYLHLCLFLFLWLIGVLYVFLPYKSLDPICMLQMFFLCYMTVALKAILIFTYYSFLFLTKKSCSSPRLQDFFPMIYAKSLVYDLFWWNISVWYKVRVSILQLPPPNMAPSCSSSIIKKDTIFPIALLCIVVKNKLTISVWVYFWTPQSLPLIYLCILH